MSRAAMYSINKSRVLDELAEMNATQKALASWMGTTPQALCRDLSKGKVSKRALLLISDLLYCDPEYLQGLSDRKRTKTSAARPIKRERFPFVGWNDDQMFIETPPDSYTTLDTIIKLACKAGFRDHIRDLIGCAPETD